MSFLPHHAETRLTRRGFLPHVHRIHVSVGRSGSAPTHHGLDTIRLTFEHRFHKSVFRVADPPRHPEGASAFPASGSEEHPLNSTGDDDPHAAHHTSVPQPGGTLRS